MSLRGIAGGFQVEVVLGARHSTSKIRMIGFSDDLLYRPIGKTYSRTGVIVLESLTSKFIRGGSCEARSNMGIMNYSV